MLGRSESYQVSSLLVLAPLRRADHDAFHFNAICWCVHCQMSHCTDRSLNRRQLKTFWTSTGTSRGQAPATEPRQEHPMTAQEVREEISHKCDKKDLHLVVYFQMLVQIFVLKTATVTEKMVCRTFLRMTS